MRIINKKSLKLAILCSLYCITSLAQDVNLEKPLNFSFKKVDEHLISRGRIYNLNSKKVVLIGMTHIAPVKFYLGVSEKIKSLDNGYKTITMQEGIHRCAEKTDSYLTLGNTFNLIKAEELYQKASPSQMVDQVALNSAGFVRTECKQKNQAYSGALAGTVGFITSPFTTYGKMAIRSGMRSQTGFARLYPKDSYVELGDAAISAMNLQDQMILAIISSCLSVLINSEKDSGNEKCSEAVHWMKNLPDGAYAEALLNTRNIVAVGKALLQLGLPVPKEYKAKYTFSKESLLQRKTVILPWGGAHLQEIATMLESQGFHLESSFDIPVASCRRVNRTKVLKKVFGDICKN